MAFICKGMKTIVYSQMEVMTQQWTDYWQLFEFRNQSFR